MRTCTYITTCERSISITSLSFHFTLFPMAKRRFDNCTSSSCSSWKHRKTGIDLKWATKFPWVEVSDDSGGMFCSLCRKHNRRPKKDLVGKAILVDLPCKKRTRQSLVSNGKSQSHTLAMRMEADLASSRKDGGISMALDSHFSREEGFHWSP